MSKFTHLHLHTEYSLLDGINRVDTLPTYIRDTLGQQACAITDHGTVAGTYKFYKQCVAAGVKPILGMEAYYACEDRTVRAKDHLGKNYHHLVLLAKNHAGLHNLYKLSTKSYETGFYHKPRIDDALIAEHSEGLLATSACLGSYSSQLILNGDLKAAEALLDHHNAMFPEGFFIEIQLHTGKEQQLVNQVLIEIAQRRGWPLVLTNDCHYTTQADKQLHEESLCMQTSNRKQPSVMSDPPYNHEARSEKTDVRTRFSFGDIDVHVAHHDWMWEQAQKQGLPYDAISNSVHITNLIEPSTYFADRMNRYPSFPGLPDDLPPWEALNQLARRKLHEKFKGSPPEVYKVRLEYELKLIKKMGFYDYLLLVRAFQNGARELGVMVGAGRGSAAGSLVAYVLRITEVDPIKHGLIFERFLNPGRAARPILLDQDMIKKIEEAPNGSHCTHSHSHEMDCHRVDSLPVIRPDSIHSNIHNLSEKQEEALGPSLLECLRNGQAIKL